MVRGRKPPFLKGRFGGNVNMNCGCKQTLYDSIRGFGYTMIAER